MQQDQFYLSASPLVQVLRNSRPAFLSTPQKSDTCLSLFGFRSVDEQRTYTSLRQKLKRDLTY